MNEERQEVLLWVRGLSHSEISGEREAFVQRAVGCRIYLRPASLLLDELTVDAFVGTKQVGCVASEDLWVCWQALDAMAEGEERMLQGVVVAAEDYRLTVRVSVPAMAKPRKVVGELGEWKYSGPVMYKTREENKLEFLTLRLSGNLQEMETEEVMELLDAFCELAIHDLSREGQSFRKSLQMRLAACNDERLRAAASRIDELSRRMGGNTFMEACGCWLKEALTTTDEALAMPTLTHPLRCIVGEAIQLPKDMLTLWHEKPAQFAKVLYGLHAQRQDVRRVISCLVWIELRERETGKRFDTLESCLSFTEMAEYCKRCVAWDDAKPIVAMMRQYIAKVGNQADEKLVNSIEEEFKKRSRIDIKTDKTDINVLSPGNNVAQEIIYRKSDGE